MRLGIRVAAAAAAFALAACGSDGGSSGRPTPSPTPTLPSVADDEATVKRALVTPADLGAPWVEPAKVNEVQKAEGELCPGQQNARTLHKARAAGIAKLTEGTGAGAPIGLFGVRAYEPGQEQQWRDAYAAAVKGCASWKSREKLYVTLEVVAAPPAVPGAEEVRAHIERVYAEASHKSLHYVRHYYEARIGRIVVSFEDAFVQPRSDPTGQDMTKSAALLARQVAKARKAFLV